MTALELGSGEKAGTMMSMVHLRLGREGESVPTCT